MKNEEKIAALGAEVRTKLLELLILAREDGLLVDTVYPCASVSPGGSEIYVSWYAHSGFGTCATSKDDVMGVIEEVDSSARESSRTVAQLREQAEELLNRASRLEVATASFRRRTP
jgi:hypothetical protein